MKWVIKVKGKHKRKNAVVGKGMITFFYYSEKAMRRNGLNSIVTLSEYSHIVPMR